MNYTTKSLKRTTIPVLVEGYELTLIKEDGTEKSITLGPMFDFLKYFVFYDGIRNEIGPEDMPEALRTLNYLEETENGVPYLKIPDDEFPDTFCYPWGTPEEIERRQQCFKEGTYLMEESEILMTYR